MNSCRCLLPALLLGLSISWGELDAAEPDLSKIPPAANRPVDFMKDIYPVIQESCVKCHGPNKHKGDYRMDTKELAFKPGKSGPNIIPGQSTKSPLLLMMAGLIEDDLMPPPDPKGKTEPLKPEQIGLFRAWIDQNAPWPDGPLPEYVKEVRYSADIAPILKSACLECHGATDQKGGLRLDLREAVLKGGKNYGAAILPGNPAKSPLMLVVSGKDEDIPLPEKHKLDEKKVQLIGKWIEQGAKWDAP